MPLETRYIVFSLAEVDRLVRRGMMRLQRPSPSDRLVCFDAWDDHFAFMYVTQTMVKLTPPEVFACVLWDCQANGVPVPRGAQKRLEVAEDQLILVCGHLAQARSAEEALCLSRRNRQCALCDGEQQHCMLHRVDDAALAAD